MLVLLLFANLFFSYIYNRGPLLAVFFILSLTVFLPLSRADQLIDSSDILYLVSIGCVSLSLLLSASLVSKNIIGADINEEYYLFRQVLEHGVWQTNVAYTYDTALSVTILPSVINMVSSIGGVWIFKYLFPVLFSLVPLMLYRVYRLILSPSYAFLSVFLFMSIPGYTNMIGLGRQEIAELLIVLLVFMAFTLKKGAAKSFVLGLLTLGVLVSHYSIAFVLFYLIIFSSVAARFFSSRMERLFSLGPLALGGVILFMYYLYVGGGSVMTQFINSLFTVASSSGKPLSGGAIPAIVQEAAVFNPNLTFLHWSSRIVQYAVAAILVIGFLTSMRFRGNTIAQRKMLPLMLASLSLVFAGAVVPYFGGILNFSRFFQIGLIFASPFFPMGIGALSSAVESILVSAPFKTRFRIPSAAKVVAIALLMLYILFTTGWVWAITTDPEPTSGVFDWQRMQRSPIIPYKFSYYASNNVEQDIAGARWIKMYGSPEQFVCSDLTSRQHVLASYAERDAKGAYHVLSDLSSCDDFAEGYVFLSTFNTATGVAISPDNQFFSLNTTSTQLVDLNLIYSGDAVVYVEPSG